MVDQNRVEVEVVARTDQFESEMAKAGKTAQTAFAGVAKTGDSSAKSAQDATQVYAEMARSWGQAHEASLKAGDGAKQYAGATGLAAAISELFNEKLGNTTRAAKGVEMAAKQMGGALLSGNIPQAGVGFGRLAMSMAMVTPVTTAVVVATAAATAGFALLGLEAMRAAERTRDVYNAHLLVGRSADYSAAHLSASNDQLRQMGTYKADVASIQGAIASIPHASDQTRESLTQLARIYAEVSKREPAEAAKELAQAFSGGVAPLREFADRMNLLTPAEKKAMDQAQIGSNILAAQDIVVAALTRRFGVLIGHLKEAQLRYESLKGTFPGFALWLVGGLESLVKSTSPLPPGAPRAPSTDDAGRAALEAKYNKTLLERSQIERDIAALERLRKEATSDSRREEVEALIDIAKRRRESVEQSLTIGSFKDAEMAIARFRSAHAADTAGIARFEAQTWKKISEDHTLSVAARQDAEKRFLAAKASLATQGRGDAMAAYKMETDLARQGSMERVMAAERERDAARRIHGQKSTQAIDAEKRYVEAVRAYEREVTEEVVAQSAIRQQRRAGDLELLDREIQFRRQIGALSATEEANQLRASALERYQIRTKELQDELQLLRDRPQEVRRVNLEIEKVYNEHRLRLQEINNRARLETINTYKSIAQPIQSSIAGAISGVITGQQTAMQALASIGQAALSSLISFGIQQLSEWVTQQLFQIGMSSAASMASSYGEIANHAAVAAAAAYASTAAIPIFGPALAPAAAAQAYGTTLGFASFVVPFAERGFDVDNEGMAYLHKREMVLPAQYGDVIRNMAEGGGQGNGGPLIGSVSVSPVGRLSRRQVMDMADMLAEAVAAKVRKFDPRLNPSSMPRRGA